MHLIHPKQFWQAREKEKNSIRKPISTMKTSDLPLWKDMPAVPGMPHGFAWGLFDKDGKRDELGTLNKLSPEAVLAARDEIKTGVSVSLNWGLEKQHQPGYGRSSLQHRLVDWKKKALELGTPPFFSYDDEISVNTQAGSQWDGQRHWAHQATGLYYNGLAHDEVPDSCHLGVDHWSKAGGIVGRGILVDFASYAEERGIAYDPMTAYKIPLDTVKAIVAEKRIEIRPGDILLMRSGWVKWYEEHSQDERTQKISHGSAWIGMEANQESIAWLWDNHFAAVAGDSIGFETAPLDPVYSFHDNCIAGWGMPIGEMWDLEALADECKKQNRWSFFLTSAPLNLKGGAASPPNAIAIF
ncbi:uncharacterized protein PV09_07824 [Verruconis gallopava]|uniref:Cyclase n=1 Tax=Verruconis gallopava TaxID=253628 RepID=A0A0D2AND0_9PEZI|nr:uncharacterized protein PV09_07824 [Verruconis gallopava]KIW00629.1 hypothetical protein PV09_07824 [Verruconis gallopava]